MNKHEFRIIRGKIPGPPEEIHHRHTFRIEVSPGMWWLLILAVFAVVLYSEGHYR